MRQLFIIVYGCSLNKIIEQAKSSCCAGVVGLGVMGEASKLTDSERGKVAEKII